MPFCGVLCVSGQSGFLRSLWKQKLYLDSYNHYTFFMFTFCVCIHHACLCVCVCDFMLHLLECYFSSPPLMCPVREQQHGSLTCHIVAWHCLMIRECWRHSAVSGATTGAAIRPQICLGLWLGLSWDNVFFLLSFYLFLCLLSFPNLFSIWMGWPFVLS